MNEVKPFRARHVTLAYKFSSLFRKAGGTVDQDYIKVLHDLRVFEEVPN